MIKKVAATVLLILLIGTAIVQAMSNQEEKKVNSQQENLGGLNIGSKAPEFELKTLSGEPAKLSDYRGKKVLLNFWATWCPPCKEEMPDMEKYSQETEDDTVILAVNIDPENNVKGFIEDNNITFPVLLDPAGKKAINTEYQVLSIPTSFFIDEKGYIRNKYVGALTYNDMQRFLR
ncbi:TlpA disulfide reductase family protein [Bacillus massiliglaciei]|uniref:TlpA disulfide reductase family protein n=1 Tax=Bacillus massiliglaciei TaxID=1816693 RepID=UPI000DA5F3C5|nr:TlpA disulfide reductase family protein [Bacillus massiliglaciei]